MYKLITIIGVVVSLLTIQLTHSQSDFHYLGSCNHQGRPNYLGDLGTVNFGKRITCALPDNYPVSRYHSNYLAETVPSDIHLTEAGDVWITFYSEDTHYRNTLAFYTYDSRVPLTTKPSSLTVVFHNVSQDNNVLHKGDNVFLGHFPANTNIGFALIRDGFHNGIIHKSNPICYTSPQLNPHKRKCSVLLCDEAQVSVLGFEDKEENTAECDGDYNDLIFYITTVPKKASLCSTCPCTYSCDDVTSGGNGGLESEGTLATAIATRQYQRAKTGIDIPEDVRFSEPKAGLLTRGDLELEQFIPEQPFTLQKVKSLVTSPKDLIGLTNAQKIVSVDYSDEVSQERVAAVLSTKTAGKVYDHTKAICDRLMGATIIDLEKVLIDDISFIRSTLKRENGHNEYVICFSVGKDQVNSKSASIISRWALDEYPEKAEYYNYQVWAESPHLVQKLTEEILAKLKNNYTLQSLEGTKLPEVYAKRGSYEQGMLTLDLVNHVNAKSLRISGRIASTETVSSSNFTKQITLSGAEAEQVQIYIGNLFNVGFELRNDKTTGYDGLYLSDGAWALDYDKNLTTIDKFDVAVGVPTVSSSQFFTVERDPVLKGSSKDYINVFRSLRPSGLSKNLSDFSTFSFKAEGTGIAEVILVKSTIKDWSKQYRTEIALFDKQQQYDLPFSSFSNGTKDKLKADDISHIVFTLNDKNATPKSFELRLENVQFNNKKVATINSDQTLTVFPNPVTAKTEIGFNLTERSMAYFTLSNAQGQTVISKTQEFVKGTNRLTLDLSQLPTGIYIASVVTAKGKMMGKIIVD